MSRCGLGFEFQGGDSYSSSQANIKTIMANQHAKDTACSRIAFIGGSFPQLRAAVLSKMGCGYLRAHLEDFPAVVLAEAAAEMQSQWGAYDILRESARAAAAGAGKGGAFAATNIGPDFDAEAAAAVRGGDVTVDLTPEEVVLGVIPLLSMALFIWFREHRPEMAGGSDLAALARAVDLCPGGSFALFEGLSPFMLAYSAATAAREDIDVDSVVQGLVQAVSASQSHHDAMRCNIIDASGRTSERWGEFADGLGQVYTTRRSHRGGGRAMYSAEDLEDIVVRLKRFIRADVARRDRVATVTNPIVPHATVRVAYAYTAATDPPVATPPPPVATPPPLTRDDLAAVVLSVLRAHSVGTTTTTPLPASGDSGGSRPHRSRGGGGRRGSGGQGRASADGAAPRAGRTDGPPRRGRDDPPRSARNRRGGGARPDTPPDSDPPPRRLARRRSGRALGADILYPAGDGAHCRD